MAQYYISSILISHQFSTLINAHQRNLNPADIRGILSLRDRNIALNWKLLRSARINGASLNHADTVSDKI
ncbi:hypothetical protein LY16_03186 [Xenorhabdus doucetiae]|uniref:Uncharacterized protein n=1 Tax=Xenorhabdus doucetiae TaxID=351671 RepID=A0ABY3NMZ4_9GAMM|nr:hypothetical protein LY16_03186 [Xenorhabdus doucetiae]